jgi:cell division septal protein FtsQ
MAVPAPTDKRFRRAHASPARRRRPFDLSSRQVAYAAVFIAVVAYGGYRGVDLVLRSKALAITDITFSGDTALSGDDVRSRLEGLYGLNTMTVNLEEWRLNVLESPWVEAVDIRRVLPGALDVSIVERRPMGVGRIGSALYLIDERGVVIDEYGPKHGNFDLPLIDGLAVGGSNSASSPAVDEDRAALAGRLMAALQGSPDLAERVSQIDVSNPRDAVVILKGDTAMIRVGTDQFVERLQAYLDVAPTLRGQVPNIDYVDVRFDRKVYVGAQPSRGGGRKIAGGG